MGGLGFKISMICFPRVIEHVDFESPLEDTSLLPHCHNDFPDSEKTFFNLAVSAHVVLLLYVYTVCSVIIHSIIVKKVCMCFNER